MKKDTKVTAHEGTDSGTSIFYKCGYGEGHCNTLPLGYPLSSLSLNVEQLMFWNKRKDGWNIIIS